MTFYRVGTDGGPTIFATIYPEGGKLPALRYPPYIPHRLPKMSPCTGYNLPSHWPSTKDIVRMRIARRRRQQRETLEAVMPWIKEMGDTVHPDSFWREP